MKNNYIKSLEEIQQKNEREYNKFRSSIVTFFKENLEKDVIFKPTKTLLKHSKGITCFQLIGNGRFISGSEDNTLKIWDIETQKCLSTLSGHTDSIRSIKLVSEKVFLSSSRNKDKTIKLWDIETGKCLRTFEISNREIQYVVNFDVFPDGRLVVLYDGIIKVWNLEDGKLLNVIGNSFNEMVSEVTACVFSSFGENEFKKLKILIGPYFKKIQEAKDDHSDQGYRTLFLTKEEILAIKEKLHQVGGDSAKELNEKIVNRFDSSPYITIRKFKLLPDGNIITECHVADYEIIEQYKTYYHKRKKINESVFTWNLKNGEYVTNIICDEDISRTQREDNRNSPIFKSFQETNLLSVSYKEISMFDLENGRKIKNFNHENGMNCFQFLTEEHLIFGTEMEVSEKIMTKDKYGSVKEEEQRKTVYEIKIINVLSRTVIRELKGHNGEITCIKVLPDGKLLSSSSDRTIKLWNLENGKCLQTLEGHSEAVTCFEVLPDGRLISGSRDSTIKIWNSSLDLYKNKEIENVRENLHKCSMQ